MTSRLRYFNSFILSGIALLGIAIVGVFKGNRWLSEPGMPENPYGWQIYLLASIIMFINGFVSIRMARQAEAERTAASAVAAQDSKAANAVQRSD